MKGIWALKLDEKLSYKCNRKTVRGSLERHDVDYGGVTKLTW
jgi:hypothetical protein